MLRTQLTTLGKSLEKISRQITPLDTDELEERRARFFAEVKATMDKDAEVALARRTTIEESKVTKEREEQEAKAAAAAKKKEDDEAKKKETAKRIKMEEKNREREKQIKIADEMELQKKKQYLVKLGKNIENMEAADFAAADTDRCVERERRASGSGAPTPKRAREQFS